MRWFFYFLLRGLIKIIYRGSLFFKVDRPCKPVFNRNRQALTIQPAKKRPGKGGTGARSSDRIYGENIRHWLTIYRKTLSPYIVPWYKHWSFPEVWWNFKTGQNRIEAKKMAAKSRHETMAKRPSYGAGKVNSFCFWSVSNNHPASEYRLPDERCLS